jgi:CubicO group peptidase (beta-lactamase class C family)
MLLPLVFALLTVQATAGDTTPKRSEPGTVAELVARLRHVLDSAKVPGIGLTMVRHDSVIYAGGIGVARVTPSLPATESTLFRIGSTSKAFVALTAQALVREGKLSLDQKLSDALPGFYFENPWEATDPVRIVHLLEHTSGFDDNSLRSYAINDPIVRPVGQGLAMDSATRVSRWRPGTRFSYCNTGPAIVALLIERIEGKSFEQVIHDRWFAPIGMKTATYFRPDTQTQSVATLYRPDGATAVPYWNVFIRPAGSINASALDMANYVRFLLGRGSIDGNVLLPAEAIDRMEHPVASTGARAGIAVGYGLHLYRHADTTGFVWTGHNGGVEGGLSDLSYMPAYGVGYAFQINSGNGEAFTEVTRLVRAFLSRGLAKPVPPPVAQLASTTRAQFGGWYRGVSPRTQHLYPLQRVADIRHVTFTDSTMRVSAVLDDPVEYVAVDSVRFRQRGAAEATWAFVRDTANGHDHGAEDFSSIGATTLAPVSTIDALGTFGTAILWMGGLALAVVAMMFGAGRRVIARLRRRSVVASPSARAWRIAAAIALMVALHVLLLSVGSGEVRTLGTATLVSVSLWVSGLLFVLVAMVGMAVTWRAPRAAGKWARVSQWGVRAVSTLNLTAAVYLTVTGWVGWRTWS